MNRKPAVPIPFAPLNGLISWCHIQTAFCKWSSWLGNGTQTIGWPVSGSWYPASIVVLLSPPLKWAIRHLLEIGNRPSIPYPFAFIIGFEVLTAAVVNVAIFWNIAACSPYVNRRFGRNYHLHLKAIPVTGRGGLYNCDILSIRKCRQSVHRWR
jgi:hypothetical protein